MKIIEGIKKGCRRGCAGASRGRGSRREKKKKKERLSAEMQITIKRKRQEKLKNSFADTKDELRAMNIRMNNAEEKRSDLEDRIMEITQS